MIPKYRAREIKQIKNGGSAWNSIEVGVYCFQETDIRRKEDPRDTIENGELNYDTANLIGTYRRNYATNFNSFWHFRKHGRDFALFSPHYTATRIMELTPDGFKDIGGEEGASGGFCPTDYYVPHIYDLQNKGVPAPNSSDGTTLMVSPIARDYDEVIHPVSFGFVAGCFWGDDSSWKIQMLNLEKVEEGIISREERFGYIELPDGLRLHQAIDCESFYYNRDSWSRNIKIAVATAFDFDSGKRRDDE